MDAAFEVDEPGVHGDPSLKVVSNSDRGLISNEQEGKVRWVKR